jgi:ribosomal protein S18 acetylase RimI-like enzyme
MEKEKELKKKSKKLFSDAFPEISGSKQRPKIHSELHTLLKTNEIDIEKINYRRIRESEQDQLISLHKEWFPVEYSEQFFKEILDNKNGTFITVAAVYSLDSEDYILGSILAECKPEIHYNSQVPEKFRHNTFFENKFRYVYIMTFGVIDECRNMKLGTKLIDKLVSEVRKVNTAVLYLHVVDYNKTAIGFYQKNGFKDVTTIKNYYNINGDIYDTKVMIRLLPTDSVFKSVYKALIALILFLPFLIKSLLCKKRKEN